MTGRVVIDMFTTLDGVAQAPGGPDEDPSGGFPFGGWQAAFMDPVGGARITDGIRRMDALLLGRRTYDLFAAYWPSHTGTDVEIANALNRVPKYVASRGAPRLSWVGSTRLGPDLRTAIGRLREQHRDIHVIGSIDLAQTLLRETLFDELHLWVYPVVLGCGKKLFPDGALPATLRLLEPAESTPKGAVLLRYAPAGPVVTGDMDAADRGL
ncbi:dihydrofolate reductase family protein [Microbacterium sp. GXF7504]